MNTEKSVATPATPPPVTLATLDATPAGIFAEVLRNLVALAKGKNPVRNCEAVLVNCFPAVSKRARLACSSPGSCTSCFSIHCAKASLLPLSLSKKLVIPSAICATDIPISSPASHIPCCIAAP